MENKIRVMRREKGITQDDFAKEIGVTRQTIISLENSRYDASLRLAHKIARYFEKSIEEIFLFEE
ncbi:MAG: helix-turn-helix transcriptional regulator [Firmicutes bacterium]|nr:helix-turn-helix transcriptional regulator [Bacillota bacterium]